MVRAMTADVLGGVGEVSGVEQYYTPSCPLPSYRQYLSCGACLEVKREDNQNCSVPVLCTTVVHNGTHTSVSSSYSSLDWVLSHWAHFTMHRFICVYLCVFVSSYCICVLVL